MARAPSVNWKFGRTWALISSNDESNEETVPRRPRELPRL